MKWIRYFLIMTLWASFDVSAQQLAQQSQYMLNDYPLNPAIAGTKEYSPLRISIRNQWAGFEGGGPKTQMISFHSNYLENMGLGGILINDITGPLTRTGLELDYSYRIRVNKESQLSFGLSAKAIQYTLEGDEITTELDGDPVFNGATEKILVPDAGFGLYYYTSTYRFGIAIPQLFHSKLNYESDQERLNKEVRHYTLTGGYDLALNKDLKLTPSFLMRTIFTAPTQFDINLMVKYRDLFFIGGSYRIKDAIVLVVGVEKNRFSLGYSYDLTQSNIKKYSRGSHEIVLGINVENAKTSKAGKRYTPLMK